MKPIAIEAAMRAWQERYSFVMGKSVPWPANKDGKLPEASDDPNLIGSYPKECFYTGCKHFEDKDAAELVRALAKSMTEVDENWGRAYLENGRLVPYPEPVLMRYIFSPGDGNMEGKGFFSLAQLVFRDRGANFLILKDLPEGSPFLDITTENYREKFYAICDYLAVADLPILMQDGPVDAAMYHQTKSRSGTSGEASAGVAKAKAMERFKDADGALFAMAPVAHIENSMSEYLDGGIRKVLYHSSVGWAGGYYQVDASHFGGEATPYTYRLDYSDYAARGGMNLPGMAGAGNTSVPVWTPSMFPDAFPPRFQALSRSPITGLWTSPLIEIDPDRVTNAALPAAFGLSRSSWNSEGWQIDCDVVVKRKWEHVLESYESDCGCSGCGTDAPLCPTADVGSVDYSINLGGDAHGKYGKLEISVERPSGLLPTPAALRRVGGQGVRSIFDYTQCVDSRRLSGTAPYEGLGGLDELTERPSLAQRPLRQLYCPKWVADVAVENDHAYSVRFFYRKDIASTPTAAGTFDVSQATPFRVFSFEAPGGDINRLQITDRIDGAVSSVVQYIYDEAADAWTLSKGTGLDARSETVAWRREGMDPVERRTVRDAAGRILSMLDSRYHVFPWNKLHSHHRQERFELVEVINDPEGDALTSTYTYYTDEGMDRGGYKRRKSVQNADGSWERYVYNVDGNVARVIRPFGDTGIGALEGDCRVSLTEERTLSDLDGDQLPERLVAEIEVIQTKEVSRSYSLVYSKTVKVGAAEVTRHDSIQCQRPGAAWDASDNLVTVERTYASGPNVGKEHSVIRPDGTMSLLSYSYSDTQRTTTAEAGAPDATNSRIVSGRRVVTVTAATGTILTSETRDIASGLVVDWQETLPEEIDAWGRALVIHYPDGTQESFQYGCCGLEAQTDRAGTTTTFLYDSLKRRRGSLRAGVTQFQVLDALGRARETRLTGTDGVTHVLSRNEYSVSGRLLSASDALGHTTRFRQQFAPNGRLQRITERPDMARVIEEYYRDGRLALTTGDAVHPAKYLQSVIADSHDGRSFNALLSTAIRVGDSGEESEWSRAYTDMLGRTYKAELPAYVGLVPSQSSQFFNAKGQLLRSVDLDGVVTLFGYNAEGQRTETAVDVNGNGRIDLSGPDRVVRNERVVVNDPVRGVVERSTTSAFLTPGSSTPTVISRTDVNATANTSWTDSFGRTSRNQTVFSGGGVVQSTTLAPSQVLSTSTTTDGLETSRRTVNAAGETLLDQTLFYDAQHRLWYTVDARNGRTTLAYNDDGSVHSVTTPVPDAQSTAQTTSYEYDILGRVRTTTLPDNTKSYREYFPTGEVSLEHGSRQFPIRYTYDSQGRMRTMVTWKDSAAGGGAATTTWDYHPARGTLSRKTYEGGKHLDYTHSPGGRLLTRIGGRGIVTTYGFDQTTGDLLTVVYSDGTPGATFTYDRAGRQETVADAAGSMRATYVDGLLQTEAYESGVLQGLSLHRTYDLARLASLSVSNSGTEVYSATYGYRDGQNRDTGRLATVEFGSGSVRYAYEPNSMLLHTTTWSDGSTDRLQAVSLFDHMNRLQSRATTDAAGLTLRSVGYGYNAANQRIRADLETGEHWKYDYDSLGQVTSGEKRSAADAVIPGYDFGYRFDDIGNRRSSEVNGRLANYQVNLLNQYENREVPRSLDVLGDGLPAAEITVNGVPSLRTAKDSGSSYFYTPQPALAAGRYDIAVRSRLASATEKVFDERRVAYQAPAQEIFLHDDDGNLTDDWRWHYTWDGENRLIAMETRAEAVAAGVPKQKLGFMYDFAGRRIAKQVSGWNPTAGVWDLVSERRFLYDGWNLLAEFSASTSAIHLVGSYVWGTDLSGAMQGAGGVGGLLAVSTESKASETFCPTYDGNGNILGYARLSDSSLVAAFEYGPFGEAVRASGAELDQFVFRFSTKYQDAETGLLYYGLRYYNPSTGRWPSRDPIEERGGLNLYGMVRNDPVGSIDLLGLEIKIMPVSKSPKYGFENKYNNQEWVNKVMDGLNQVIGDAGVLEARYDGYQGWNLAIKSENPASKCSPCFAQLKAAIETGDKLIKINYDPSELANAHGGNKGYVRNVGINPDANILSMVTPDGYVPGSPYVPETEYEPFAAVLWHETIGHAFYGYSHPKEDWNVHFDSSPEQDAVIAIENMALDCMRKNGLQYKNRYPKYYNSESQAGWGRK